MPPKDQINQNTSNHHNAHSFNSQQLKNKRRVNWHGRRDLNLGAPQPAAVPWAAHKTKIFAGFLVGLSIGAFFGGRAVVSHIASSTKTVQPQSTSQQTDLNNLDSGNLNLQQYNVTSTLPSANCPALATRENAVFWYQNIDDNDITKFGCPRVLVGNYDWSAQNLADIKQVTGTQTFSYLEMYWFPASGKFDGLDLSTVTGWQFCNSSNAPLLGNFSGSAHPDWYYVDLNSKAVINSYKAYLLAQKAKGFDGVFLDTGGQAMVYGKIWNKKSTCTKDPIDSSWTAADGFSKLINAAHSVGMKAFVNVGVSPDLNVPKLRPNPNSAACVSSLASCVPYDDVMRNADYVLNEGVANSFDASGWQYTIDQLYSDQNTPLNPARSHAVVVAMGRYGGPDDSTKDDHILYQWSTMKLYDVMVDFGTGDDNGGGNRHGIAPAALTNVRLGDPLKMWGKPGYIGSDKVNGIWYRRYKNGLVLVNNTSTVRVSGSIPIFDDGTCKYLRTQPSNRLIASGRCVKAVNRSLKPFSAEVLTYSDSGL
ncbi:MAG: hypothetical protein ACXWLH_01200 [Candidatus Saccharimonadales bacterium]